MDYVGNAQLQDKQVQNAGGDLSYEQNGLKLNKGFFKLRTRVTQEQGDCCQGQKGLKYRRDSRTGLTQRTGQFKFRKGVTQEKGVTQVQSRVRTGVVTQVKNRGSSS